MPVSLSQIIGNVATTSFSVGEHSIEIRYKPSLITEETHALLQNMDAMKNSEEIKRGFKTLNEILVELIDSWDFYEDEACTQMVPITVNRMKLLPIYFRVQALMSIMGDFRPEMMAPQEKIQSS